MYRPWLFALSILIACSSSASSPSEPEPVVAPESTEDAERVLAELHEPGAAIKSGPIVITSTQLIVSLSDGWSGTDATLYRFTREAGEILWQAEGEPIASTLGRTGLGWGRGLHGAVAERGEPTKREGDGRSPAGVFPIGRAYGYAAAPGGTSLPYNKVGKSWRCVNDAASIHYNRILDAHGLEKDWQEAERMRRWDDLYELVIEVDHNHIVPSEIAPTANDGSCIFLHVWRRPGAPTIGCTAMPLTAMRSLLTWLSPEAEPVLVALPAARYESLRAAWQLPKI
ncbi:MAG: hypothetical protein GY811_11460 [Myxococcales bacterium]|nr:hypothetical protein [Myxococcales bacterium]